MSRLLIIDDDQDLCAMLSEYLNAHEHEVSCRHTGTSGLEAALNLQPDMVLLDVMLPELNGFDVLRQLRSKSRVPVLMLTARGDEIDRVLGLELGADDYLAKPFSHRELVARIQAILRRISPAQEPTGALVLHAGSMQAEFYNTAVDLTAAEFRVLNVLYGNAGEVVDKNAICEQAFGRKLHPYDRHIDIHVSHIRKKLADINPIESIKTIRGSGYQLLVHHAS
ncbi:response regulator transcription factor [Gilvimarinus agarilyticus]|uniref:response regulator transcription factor n=1 Tax=unclassified Gilvimarinus TaxID=2642066 RepID=UPI001C08E8C2|nr:MULTISPECIES: response regulator transcription factor [unclassified Gilvimarinus]MBU2886888.1 response regulator transcription factor [Gilvimarinus agarilyticus]MDO6571549.1 response regulator transcription factor [Gilvimarinus sp. 2_MG-2023]MDO6747928.1 response regulator transcription factor [Gilvimarinus sp. 1_MG-2023]